MPDKEARGRIIKAVQDLLREGCPAEGVTVRKIAQKAGVGIGTVSYHFHSKDKLVYEAVAAQMTDMAGTLAPGEGEGSAFERLRRFLFGTADLAMRYSDIFRMQLSYYIVHEDMSICYTVTPLLREHYDNAKSDLEIKLIALEIVTTMQIILLKLEAFQQYTGVDIRNARQREEALDILLNTAMKI